MHDRPVPPPGFLEGFGVAFRLWEALAADDDAAVAAAMMPEAFAAWGPIEGIAARIREHREVARDDCSKIGSVWPVAILEGEGLRAFFTVYEAGEATELPAHTPVVGWSLEVYRRDGRWLVNPTPVKLAKVIGYVHPDGRTEPVTQDQPRKLD